MDKAFDELKELLQDFNGKIVNSSQAESDILMFLYKCGGESWLTIKEESDEGSGSVSTINLHGDTLHDLKEFLNQEL